MCVNALLADNTHCFARRSQLMFLSHHCDAVQHGIIQKLAFADVLNLQGVINTSVLSISVWFCLLLEKHSNACFLKRFQSAIVQKCCFITSNHGWQCEEQSTSVQKARQSNADWAQHMRCFLSAQFLTTPCQFFVDLHLCLLFLMFSWPDIFTGCFSCKIVTVFWMFSAFKSLQHSALPPMMCLIMATQFWG